MAYFERRASERMLETIHNWAKRGDLEKIIEFQKKQTANGVAASRALSETDHVMQATPLHFAAENGHTELVKFLLNNGVPVEMRDRAGCGPLHYAAGNGWVAVVRLLVGHGASAQAKDSRGDTPLHWAASNRDPEQSDDAEEEEGEQRNHVETIRLLVKLGQVTDAQNNDGWTALHRAAYNGRVATIRALCEVGASVNIGNHNGDTPLHLAALGGQVDAVECLIEMGARTTMVNKEGKSAADVTGNDGLAELIRETEEYKRLGPAGEARGLMNKHMSGMDSLDPAQARALQQAAIAELAALGISKGGQGRRGDDGDNLDSGNVGSMLRRQFSRQASVRKAQGSLPGMDDSDGEDDSPSRGPGSSHTGYSRGRSRMQSDRQQAGSESMAPIDETGGPGGTGFNAWSSGIGAVPEEGGEGLSGWDGADYQAKVKAANREQMRESGVLSTRSGAPGVEHPRGGSGGNQAFLRKYSLEKRGLFAP